MLLQPQSDRRHGKGFADTNPIVVLEVSAAGVFRQPCGDLGRSVNTEGEVCDPLADQRIGRPSGRANCDVGIMPGQVEPRIGHRYLNADTRVQRREGRDVARKNGIEERIRRGDRDTALQPQVHGQECRG